jgi:lipoprotein-anchoring transpeptidase ErfK/SrfK
MADIDLHLYLSTNRDQSGVLIVRDAQSGREIGRFQALGRGNRGPGETQMTVEGSTPTGVYKVRRRTHTSSQDSEKYGPNGALELTPLSGRAVDAERLVGRSGLLIHGGSLGAPKQGRDYWRGNGQLRATQGCVRLSNDSMKELLNVLRDAQEDNATGQSRVPDVTLTVDEFPASMDVPSL